MPYTCRGCDNTWTGLNYCHCSACHRTFGGVDVFDMHRRMEKRSDRGSDPRDYCADPSTLGTEKRPVIQDDKGIWRRIPAGRKHPQSQ